MLLELAKVYDLVWATAWEDVSNPYFAARLGIPDLPFVDFDAIGQRAEPLPQLPIRFSHQDSDGYVNWKTPRIAEYANGRDFAWIDDEMTEDDARYLRRLHPSDSGSDRPTHRSHRPRR